ncbi:MAG: AAA family ATPase [Deltaproteobacteria bacterium]|jgi:hypothetical protein|nr:AAA family ATPase [Deltaproteobacteria bacterium]
MADVIESRVPKLLIGHQSFVRFMKGKAAFVDKTEIISELISERGWTYFLSRPRRFGKTLLLNTIKCIFEGKKELFKDLDIVKNDLWPVWEPLPVISLSFNKYPKNPESMRKRLIMELNKIIRNNELPMREVTEVSDIALIIESLSERQAMKSRAAGVGLNYGDEDGHIDDDDPNNVVLLVDEYDYPLLINLANDKGVDEIGNLLHEFYSAIKSCYEMLRFTLITGITKFRQLSLFSGLNNIQDITLDAKYSAICGFSKDDISRHFGYHISETLKSMKENKFLGTDSTDETLMTMITEWYDGYSWDGIHRVLNPYSVARLFNGHEFDYYWYLSGAPLFVVLLTLKSDAYFKIFSKSFRIGDKLPLMDVHNIEDEAALFQAGYLTVDTIDESVMPHQRILKVPNTEIGYAIVQEFVNRRGILNISSETINSKYGAFVDAFDSHNENDCSSLFSSCIAEIASSPHFHAELAPQVMMYTLLNIKGPRARMEQIVGNGRIDLIYTSPGKDVTVVEIKYGKPKKTITPEKKQELLDKAVSNGFDQSQNKRYALSFFINSHNV